MRKPRDIPDLREIIDSADVDLLRDFLWKHTKRSSAFELKLRAYLVEGVEVPPGINKYSQVLGILVRHDVHGTIRLTRRSVQVLRDICEHFVGLQERHLQDGALRSAWEVGIAVISHLHMLMDKYHGPDAKLITILSGCYAHVLALLQLNPAPELRQTIHTELWSIVKRSHHVIYDVNFNTITCLIQSASDIDEYREITNLVVEKIRTSIAGEPQQKLWQALLLKIPVADVDITAQINATDAYDIAYLLHASNDTFAISRLLNVFDRPRELSIGQQKQWQKWKFEFDLQNGIAGDIQDSGWKLLGLDEDLDLYLRMREAAGVSFDSDKIVMANISNDFKSEIYAFEQDWDAFAMVLRKSASLPLLIHYCKDILRHVKEPEALIYDVTAAYAEHHAGTQTIEHVALVLETIRTLRYEDLVVSIAERLKTEFPGRFDEMKLKKMKGGKRRISNFE